MATAGAILTDLIGAARARVGPRPLMIGVAGPQGSGKTTLRDAFCDATPSAVGFSLDDVYLGRAERAALARDIHPLLATRGPPGTHDLALLNDTIDALIAGAPTPLPYFDKVSDEPTPQTTWEIHTRRAEIVLIDGWCLGAMAQTAAELAAPINSLEAEEDRDGVWRGYINEQLAGPYQAVFNRFDAILYLDAPRFEIVLDWRCQQEEGLLGRALDEAGRARIARFIQHFERITRHMMAGGRREGVVVELDERRTVRA